jgi:Uma2 family endonuclease
MAMPLAHRRFTVDEYHRMAETGILGENDRVELLDGEIVEMTPIGPGHAGCVDDLVRLFYRVAGEAVILGVQRPLAVGTHWEPQPDVAVLKPRPQGYRRVHPRPSDVVLLIEVADSSLEFDRAVKLPLYARAGIAEVWLVNLRATQIEVYRAPRDGAYTDRRVLGRDATLTVLGLPGITLPARDILG